MNITDPLRERAQLHADRTAVIKLGGAAVSYGEFDRTVDAVAQRLLAHGLRAGQTVMVAFSPPYMFLVLALAAARIGVASATPGHPPTACAGCLAPDNMPPIAGMRMIPVPPDWFDAPPPEAIVPRVPSHQDDAAICAYFDSSGTTGTPKHIGISHALLTRRIAAKERFAPLPGEPRQIFAVGPRAAYGFRDTMRVLGQGGLVVFTGTLDDILTGIARYAINYLVVAPALVQRLVEARPADAGPFPSLATVEVGGSHLPHALWQRARERLCPHILSTYGATETGSVASAPMEDLVDHPGAVGHLYAGVDMEAVDEHDRPLPAGTEGILRVRSDLLADGYFDDPAATAEAFRDGWFYPGDLGAVSPQRHLVITGRVAEVINNGGDKISPHVIEEVLRAQPGIVDAAAFGMPDADGMTKVWAAVVTRAPFDMDTVMRGCLDLLRGRAPQSIVVVDELPRNANGKVVREELAKFAQRSWRRR